MTTLQMPTISNPILRGFNPDPSIVRVGDDYYIATSTFEWYPGVQIHHSRDLVHWRLLTRPLRRASQLDMRGDPDSCGIWAPCLTHADGRFWLIYTDVKRYGRASAGVLGRVAARLSQLSRHVRHDRRRVERPDPAQQQRLRSLALPRRRRPQVSREHAVGPPPERAPLRRDRAAGILGRRREARRRAGEHLRRHVDRLHRGAASLQARRLVLSDHSRGRDVLGTRGDDGALAEPHRAVRAASRHVRADGATSSRRAAAEGGARRSRRDAEWRDVDRVSLRPPAAQSRAVHAGPRDGDPADGVGRRRLAAHDRRRADPAARRRTRPICRRTSFPAAPRAPTSTMRRCRSTSSGCARRITRSCSVSTRVRVICGCMDASRSAASSASRSSRGDSSRTATARRRDGVRAGALPAGGGSRVLLRRHEVPLPVRLARREDGEVSPGDVRASRGRACRRLLARRSRCRTASASSFASKSTRSGCCSRIGRRRGRRWQWLPEQFDASILSDEAAAAGTANFTGAFVGMACQDVAGTALHADFDWFEYREREYVVDPR